MKRIIFLLASAWIGIYQGYASSGGTDESVDSEDEDLVTVETYTTNQMCLDLKNDQVDLKNAICDNQVEDSF